jgi:hypothetical protein
MLVRGVRLTAAGLDDLRFSPVLLPGKRRNDVAPGMISESLHPRIDDVQRLGAGCHQLRQGTELIVLRRAGEGDRL